MDQILIKDLLVRTVIGIDEHERSRLTEVLINLVIFTDIAKAGRSDDIEDCINYATMTEQVQALVEKAARYTVEALAEDIARFCLDTPGVSGVKVRIEKPGVVNFTRLVGVEIERYAASGLHIDPAALAGSTIRPQGREWKIRPAVVADIPALVELRLGLFESMQHIDPAEWDGFRKVSTEYMQQKIPTGEYMSWVADVNGQAVASGGVVIRSAPPTIHNHRGLEGYVLSVFTVPEWRKQGMARAIMNTIIGYLREKGITKVTLRATEQGRPLYLSLGFASDERTMAMDI
jgi:D-erythro-7,8-dihydroneopterin triphosphate epimerase